MWGFGPKWLRLLPRHLRPDSAKIRALEDLRQRYRLPHEMLAAGIVQSEQTTIRLQHFMLKRVRAELPNASEKELWKVVLVSRAQSAALAGTESMDEGQINRIVDNAESFEDACKAIIDHERPQRAPDMSGIQDEIDTLLSGRFSLIACSKCSYEFPLLQGVFLRGMMATCPKCSYEFVPNSANFRATPNVKPQQKQQLDLEEHTGSLIITCEQCSQKLRIPIRQQTLLVRCPRCSRETTVCPAGHSQQPPSKQNAQPEHQEKKDFDEWPPRKLPK